MNTPKRIGYFNNRELSGSGCFVFNLYKVRVCPAGIALRFRGKSTVTLSLIDLRLEKHRKCKIILTPTYLV